MDPSPICVSYLSFLRKPVIFVGATSLMNIKHHVQLLMFVGCDRQLIDEHKLCSSA
jgi:hypothetical protein